MKEQLGKRRSARKLRRFAAAATLMLNGIALSGCAGQQTVILATHDSFAISDELIAEFEAESGYQLEVMRLGDTGSLVSRLALTVSAPLADAYYGIDNTFMERARAAGLIGTEPTPINYGDVCFNYDLAWFTESQLNVPENWQQLASPEYAPLTVITDPRMSSPGMSFLMSTGQYFDSIDEVSTFWADLKANGVRVAASWEDAYFLDFTRYGGDRPIVLSYASSPAAEVDAEGNPQTAAIRSDCFRQVEYSGVLPNAANPRGAETLIEFLISDSFQSQLPDLMYVYPISESVALDSSWLEAAPPAISFFTSTTDVASLQTELMPIWEQVFAR